MPVFSMRRARSATGFAMAADAGRHPLRGTTRGKMAFAVPGDIATTTGGYLYDRRMAEALTTLDVEVRRLRFGDSFPQPTARDMANAIGQLRALPPDCPVLVDGLAYGALDTMALAEVRAPLVALVHHPLALEPGLSPDVARAMAAREAANLALARHIVATSPHIAGLLRDTYGVAASRLSVARPGFVPPIQARGARDTPPLILSVGLLARRKGHDILLRALSQIVDLDWRATIVGRVHEPETARGLHDLRADLGLSARVSIAGELPQHALDALYRRASLFALATRYEGYGIVYGEAMGYGLPIVSTLVGAVPDTVAPRAGVLAPSENPEAFAEALRRLLTDAVLWDGCAAEALRAAAHLGNWRAAASIVAGVLFGPESAP